MFKNNVIVGKLITVNGKHIIVEKYDHKGEPEVFVEILNHEQAFESGYETAYFCLKHEKDNLLIRHICSQVVELGWEPVMAGW